MSRQSRQAPGFFQTHEKTLRKWCARILASILVIFLLCLAALGGIYWYLQRDPQALATEYLEAIEKATGLKCSFGTVIVTLVPLPSVAVYDLQIKGGNAELAIALAQATPAIGDILQGRFIPASLGLYRPVFTLRTDLRLDEPSSLPRLKEYLPTAGNNSGSSGDSRPNLPDKISLTIQNGRIRLFGADRSGIFSRNLHGLLEFSSGQTFNGSVEASRIRLYHQRKMLFSIDDPHFSMFMHRNIPEKLQASAGINFPGWLDRCMVSLDYSHPKDKDWTLIPEINGFFTSGEADLPIALSGRVTGSGENLISCQDMNFRADADNGQLAMLIKTAPELKDWSAQGTLQLVRASLTEWLGFARNLPPGLQIALDNITRGRLEFRLNAKSLEVDSIIANSTGATFTGKGGVADFSRPVVALDLQSPRVNLGLALPESLAETPDPVYFPFEPLTPMPGEPLKEGETGIGYDVRLAAETLIYGPLKLKNAKLRIYQGKLDKKLMLEDVLLDGRAELGQGNITANCILGADPSLPCNIKGAASNINAATIAAQWKEFPLTKGVLKANANIFSKGKTLADFLKNLNGPVSVSGSGIQAKSGIKSAISSVELSCRLRSAQREKNGVSFDGQWRAAAKMDIMDISSDLSGRVQLDEKGLYLRSLGGSATLGLRNVANFLPKNLPVSLKGTINGRTHDQIFTAQKLEVKALEAQASGNAVFNASKLSCKGTAQIQIPSLKSTLAAMGVKSASVPAPFQKLVVDTEYAVTEDRIKLEKTTAKAGAIQLNGQISLLKKTQPELEFDITSSPLDLKDFIGDTKSSGTRKWDFSSLKELNANGRFKIQSLTAYGLNFRNINTPLKLTRGKLVLGPASAIFCGANVNTRANMEFNSGIHFSSFFSVKGFNLGQAAKDRKIESELSGSASLEGNLRGDLAAFGQMARSIDGNWAITVTNGSWQGRDKKGALEDKPVKFDLVSASGTLRDARIQTDNLLLKSPGLKVDGTGWLNIENNKIDSTLNVDMKNVPNFPLHIYGTLDKPKTSIGAGRMVLNAIGGVTTGIANILGGMVEGVWNIFR